MLVPLGDPGSLWPTDAMCLTKHFVEILHEYHPEAGVWVAPQHFQPEPGWYDTFYEEIAKEPDWITGVCFAPWEQDSIEELYEKLPENIVKTFGTTRIFPTIRTVSSRWKTGIWRLH